MTTKTFPETGAELPEIASKARPETKTWLHVVSHLDPKYGGLSTVVPQLCTSLADGRWCSAELAAFCAPGEVCRPATHDDLPLSAWPTSRTAWLRNGELRAQFDEKVRGADGVHIHGLWEQSTWSAARTARSFGKPYVLSAHGMLDGWAVANKRLKKAVYSTLFERANVAGAACLLALTRTEAENYRRFGAKGPIAVIPNGVDVPEVIDPELFLMQFPALRGKRLVLFLGRIHFKKGLDILIGAWARLAKQWPEAHLVLAGPDSEGTRAGVEAEMVRHGIGEQVTFTGMLRDGMKWSALEAAECFVLPSYSEGLSTAVLEAMGVGLPVIVTQQCNVPEVKIYETGWEIESNVESLTLSLSSFLTALPTENRAMGDRGKRLVREQYGWPSVASRMSKVYEWVAGGVLPSGVDLAMGSL